MQAARTRVPYGANMPRRQPPRRKTPAADPDSLLYWLARTCREEREAAGRLTVHIAAVIGKNQSSITRFESGTTWSRDIHQVVGAYAEDLGTTSDALWEKALHAWRHRNASRYPDLADAIRRGEAVDRRLGEGRRRDDAVQGEPDDLAAGD